MTAHAFHEKIPWVLGFLQGNIALRVIPTDVFEVPSRQRTIEGERGSLPRSCFRKYHNLIKYKIAGLYRPIACIKIDRYSCVKPEIKREMRSFMLIP